jgi:hypothetical protein
MYANAVIVGDGSSIIRLLNWRSTDKTVRSLVLFADMDALRYVFILPIAEKLRSADADATGIVNANLKSASRSGNAQLMAVS